MVKNKHNQNQKFETIIEHVGLAVVALATVLNMAELHGRENHTAVLGLTPAYAAVTAEAPHGASPIEELRRGAKEEVRHTSASYGVVMRSHPVSGTL